MNQASHVRTVVFLTRYVSSVPARAHEDIALLRAGEADQVAFGIAEVANDQASPGLTLGAHQALPSEALGLFERGFNIRNPNVKERMALIARASADATGNACPVTGRVAVHKAVISALRNSLRDRAARVELPMTSKCKTGCPIVGPSKRSQIS
jgi:hypothetical protein